MRIAVTGASGFIGRALCPALAAAGHEVVPCSLRVGAEPLRLEGVAALVHLAAIAHRRSVSRARLHEVNVALARRMGEASAACGTRLIFLSSVKVHGEESRAPFTERSPIAPRDAYAESKARAEDALRAIAGLHLTVVRPPLVYGPGVKANFLSLMKALAQGWPLPFAAVENRRSLVYAGNLCDFLVRCAADAGASGTYLVSDGAPLSTAELCRRLGSALGRPAHLFAFPPRLLELWPAMKRLTRSLEIDDTASRAALGWRAPYSVEQGLVETARWYRSR